MVIDGWRRMVRSPRIVIVVCAQTSVSIKIRKISSGDRFYRNFSPFFSLFFFFVFLLPQISIQDSNDAYNMYPSDYLIVNYIFHCNNDMRMWCGWCWSIRRLQSKEFALHARCAMVELFCIIIFCLRIVQFEPDADQDLI